MGYSISGVELIDDQTGEVIDAVTAALLRAFTKIGGKAEGYAKALCPVDTGNLRNSITFQTDPEEEGVYVTIGTNVEYAPYIELGTGKEYEPPPEWMEAHGGKKGRGLDSWMYQDADGNWHRAFPRRPVKFIQRAVKNHIEEYEDIITNALQSIE